MNIHRLGLMFTDIIISNINFLSLDAAPTPN